MTKKDSIAAVTTSLFETLEPLDSVERMRAISAALTLLGETNVPSLAQPFGEPNDSLDGQSSPAKHKRANNTGMDAKAFFDSKQPDSKMEELAVAAAYRETLGFLEHTKEELRDVITAARRNFDTANFSRDMANAKAKKGLFNKGTGHPLSLLWTRICRCSARQGRC